MAASLLPTLPPDVWTQLSEYLLIFDLFKLLACGNTALTVVLTAFGGVKTVKILYEPPAPFVFPRFLAKFTQLHTCELDCTSNRAIRDVNAYWLPKSIRKLRLHFSNSSDVQYVFDPDMRAVLIKFTELFPHLQVLELHDTMLPDYVVKSLPPTLQQLGVVEIMYSDLTLLPSSLTKLEVIIMEAPAEWPKEAVLPPNLRTLSTQQLCNSTILPWLPSTLETLELDFSNWEEQESDYDEIELWKTLPTSLTHLVLACHTLTASMAVCLPRQLVHLELIPRSVEEAHMEQIIECLPKTLKSLAMPNGPALSARALAKLPRGLLEVPHWVTTHIKTAEELSAVPPSLTSFTSALPGSLMRLLPSTVARLVISHTATELTDRAEFPAALKSLTSLGSSQALRTAVMASLAFNAPRLTHLHTVHATFDETRSITLLPTSLTFLGAKFATWDEIVAGDLFSRFSVLQTLRLADVLSVNQDTMNGLPTSLRSLALQVLEVPADHLFCLTRLTRLKTVNFGRIQNVVTDAHVEALPRSLTALFLRSTANQGGWAELGPKSLECIRTLAAWELRLLDGPPTGQWPPTTTLFSSAGL